MLCDGRLVCGCADPYGRRVLGDARTSSIHGVWSGALVTQLRRDLNAGGSKFCGDCALKLPLKKGEPPVMRPLDAGPLPSRMFIECTAACNISCAQACCAPETGITRTRQSGMLDFELFRRVVDEAAPTLGRIDFFNYGEAFLHKRAIEMCEYFKTSYPHIYLYTSTNGLAFSEPQARRIAHSGIDEVTFSIDGATKESYAKYRQRGQLDVALANLGAMIDEKRRCGLDLPFLNWRYILFTWNDSDVEMNLARRMAADLGVDRLCWEITDHPEDSYSRRFVPGSPDFDTIRGEIWDHDNLGNAIPGATPKARIDVCTLVPALPLIARPGRTLQVRTRVHNLSAPPVSLRCDLWAASRAPRRPAMRQRRHPHQPRLRACGPAADDCRRRGGRRVDQVPTLAADGTLHDQVRSSQRRCGLVRALWLGHHGKEAVGEIVSSPGAARRF